MLNIDQFNILLAATGSVASIKIPLLTELLLQLNESFPEKTFSVQLLVTEHAKHFFTKEALPSDVKLVSDCDEWSSWQARGDPVLHIELTKWADLMLIAPLDANTLSKMSQGICDNLLTCTTRAWDMKKPLLFCPAMNTRMWEHPITSKQIETLKSWGHIEVPCISKTLMCGDTGLGAMAELITIIDHVKTFLS